MRASSLDLKNSPCVALVVDEDRAIRRQLRIVLENERYRVRECELPQMAPNEAVRHRPDIIILDPGDSQGVATIEALRQLMIASLVVLSASARDRDKVAALDAGADDFITKPFHVPELLARVRAIRRRTLAGEAGTADRQLGDLHIDLIHKIVTLKGVPLRLSRTEFAILATMVELRGATITTDSLAEAIGCHAQHKPHLLRVYVSQLRRKLECDPSRPRYLLTEPNSGYRLVAPCNMPA